MLILVLIPVIAAEDSSEAFYIEYAEDSTEDVIVEESYSTDEVESAQEHTFISNENDDVGNDYEDLPTQTNHFEEAVEDNCDANIIEHVECSAEVSQDIHPGRRRNPGVRSWPKNQEKDFYYNKNLLMEIN